MKAVLTILLVIALTLFSVPNVHSTSVQQGADCWTDKSVYQIGDIVTIYVSLSGGVYALISAWYALVIYLPDGTQVSVDLGHVPNDGAPHGVSNVAGSPAGQRRVEFYEYNLNLPGATLLAYCGFYVEGTQPPGSPLQVSISANLTNGPVPLPVSFSSSVKGGKPPYLYNWDFGDGSRSNKENPSHSYFGKGTYHVTLTVRDSSGNSATDSLTITASAQSFSCPDLPEPTIVNLSSGNMISFILTEVIDQAIPATHIPLAQDRITINPSTASSQIQSVQVQITEMDSDNYANIPVNPLQASQRSDGSYALDIVVQDRELHSPINTFWGILELAAEFGGPTGEAISTALDGLGVLDVAQPPPDLQLSMEVRVGYQNGGCHYGPYRLPTLYSGIQDRAHEIVDWFNKNKPWLLSLHSNADIMAIDSNGRRVGALYENGVFEREVNEIPGSMYSGHGTTPQTMMLPAGSYQVELHGTGNGEYSLRASTSANWLVQTQRGQSESGTVVRYSLSSSTLAGGAKVGGYVNIAQVGAVAALTASIVILCSEVLLRRRRRRRHRRLH
jgi:PKD repeat protein